MTTVVTSMRFACRRRTAADWTSGNEILLAGEIGYETDTDKFKIGDGSTPWNSIAGYFNKGGGDAEIRRYDESGDYQYQGSAPQGSAEGDAVWTIYRLTYAGGAYVETKSATNVTWTGRAGHTYT